MSASLPDVVYAETRRASCVTAPATTATRRAPERPPARHPPPALSSLLNTLNEAQTRKRQREQLEREQYEASCNLRTIGVQTNQIGWEDETVDVEEEEVVRESGIATTKRIKLDLEKNPESTQADASTLTVPHEFPSQHEDFLTPNPREIPMEVARLIAANAFPAHSDSARRIARRSSRSRRNHNPSEPIRVHTDPYMQQVRGVVPGNEHTCDRRCPHHRIAPSTTGSNSVSPTIAPASYPTRYGAPPPPPPVIIAQQQQQQQQQQHQHHPPMPPSRYPYLLPGAHAVANSMGMPMIQMLGVMVPMPLPMPMSHLQGVITAPPPPSQGPFHNLYTFRPLSSSYPEPPNMLSPMYRPMDYLFPPMDRLGLERLHMFTGLDLDVPVGASRADIDRWTVTAAYKKPADDDEEATCTVCLSGYDDGENIRRLSCNHFFHPECIDRWLDINKKCPMCREEIDRDRVPPPVLRVAQ